MTDKDGNPIVTARLSFSNWVALAALIVGTGGSIAIGALKLWMDHEHRITVLEARTGIVRTAGAVAPLLALALLLGGCSAKEAISGAASSVQESAHQTIELVTPAAEGTGELAQGDAKAVVKLQESIIKQAITVQRKVVHVKDEPTFFDRVLDILPWLAAVAVAGLVTVIGAQTGAFAVVGAVLKRVAAWLRLRKPDPPDEG